MWTFVWFLLGLLTGLTFALSSPALQQRLAPLTTQSVSDDRKAHNSGHVKTETLSTTTSPPTSNPPANEKPLTTTATTAQQDRHQRVVVESDPLHASELITTTATKKSSKSAEHSGASNRNGKTGRGSLRRRAGTGAGGALSSISKADKGDHITARNGGAPNNHRAIGAIGTTPTGNTGITPALATTTTPRHQNSFRIKLSSTTTSTVFVPETPTTGMGMDTIPMDAESRWRDHHLKRQWAQSLLIESMEPVLSRHLRHAIKSVLHFTNVGPEIMDLKGATQGMGQWDAFASPMIFPPRTAVPHSALSNSIQINHQASTPVTATPTQTIPLPFPTAPSHITTRTDHIRIPSAQQRTRSASINSLSQLLETNRAGEAPFSKDPSTSTKAPEVTTSLQSTHKSRTASTSSTASPTIVVRGFTSATSATSATLTASTPVRTATAEEAKSKSTMMVEAEDLSELDLRPSNSRLQPIGSSMLAAAAVATVATIDTTDNQAATLQPSNDHGSESSPNGEAQGHAQDSALEFSSSNNSNDNSSNNNTNIPAAHDLVPSKPRHSRLWSKMRKAVYGEPKQQQDSPRNTIYLATGGGTTSRSMSDTNLSPSSSRPVSTSSMSSPNNITMPSFSSSVLSVLSEDQMSLLRDVPKATIIMSQLPKVSAAAFETPPETAPNSPTQTVTPTSPTARSKFGFQHSLPGLARRSSAKSPVAAAEVTTAESRVSQFMYAGQTSRPESTKSRSRVQSSSSSSIATTYTASNSAAGLVQDTPLVDLNLHSEYFLTPNALERPKFKSVLNSSANIPDPDSTPKPLGPDGSTTQLGRSKSTSSAQRRETRLPKSPSQTSGAGLKESFQDGEQFLTAQRQFREFGVLSPPRENPLKDGTSLDLPQRGDEELVAPSSPPMFARNGSNRPLTASSPHQQQTSALSPNGRPLSPSQMLSGSSDILPEQSKQDRRKSAISFGGYFSNPSAAASRRTRDSTGHSISGLETDPQGEIIHMRRTSFFDKASPPTLASLASLLQTNLPSLSQSLRGTDSPSLSRSPSKSSGLAQEQRPQLQGRPSITTEGATTAETDSPKPTPRDLRKRITPLKITPLLMSGVTSLPSPMFPPLSSTIPRPLGSATFGAPPPLGRYFFNVDQVHEWNIPSYGRVRFTDHAPLVFHAIRERFQYTLADMDEALSQPMTVMKTPGKSDAIFFASHNHGRFLLKTLRGAEPDNLKGFLSDYLAHIQKYPNTLLPRYLGMYTFEKLAGSKLASGTSGVPGVADGTGLGSLSGSGLSFGGDRENSSSVGGAARNRTDATAAQHLHLNGTLLSGKDEGLPSKVVVVVLANVFDTPEVVHERYDFKGSNVGRRTLPADGVVVRESRSTNNLNASVPDLQQSRVSMEKEPSWTDFAHRQSQQWRTHQIATGENRSSSMYYEPRSDPIYPHLQSGGGLGGNGRMGVTDGEHGGAGGVGSGGVATADISHLTLKEMDFQNRIFTGETQLIHLGSTRKAEVLTQLEEDTVLLRKHGFMDYSMLVGIRIVPKRPVVKEPEIYPSPESSRRGSVSSRGSDADNSHLDSDLDGSSIHDSITSISEGNKKAEPKREIEEALDRLWKFISLSEERLVFLRGIGEMAQEAFRDVYSFGEVIVSGGGQPGTGAASDATIFPAPATANGSRKESKSDKKDTRRAPPPPEVELTAVKSDCSKHHHHHHYHHSRKHKDREQDESNNKDTKARRGLFDDEMDPNSFQTVRYRPRTESHSSSRPKLSVLIDSTVTGKKASLEIPRHQSMTDGVPILPHPATAGAAASRFYSSPPLQSSSFQQHDPSAGFHSGNLHDPNQAASMWSQGVPSLGLPDGYEAVYYFGLIDVLQKYNLVKWLERNIKGANVRLLGNNGGGGSPLTAGPPSSVPLVMHPGRSNPSTSSSFASSTFYQLLPHAASEPSLPSAIDSTSSSAATTAAGTASGAAPTNTNPTLSVLLEDSGSGHGSSSSSSTSSRNPPSNRGSFLLDPNSSYSQSSVSTPISSARVSQEESTLSSSPTNMMMMDDSGKPLPTSSPFASSQSPSPPSIGVGGSAVGQVHTKLRLSSSAPFSKSIMGVRLSQYSQYSHSSQQSAHSHISGRSRDSRLSFDIRASSNGSESMLPQPHHSSSSSSSLPTMSDGAQIHIPSGQTQTQTQTLQTQAQTQSFQAKPSHHVQYQVPQHAEVSVEEPGRYAERLIEFMRGALV
ncbi:Phosphatidylinositol 4-phosphate 5-kinase 9 [Mortierella sp. AD031]|nr:Phosphatidylinositol 4-phosphate 5-kinase 9 [Mortierella sp. AD031]